MSGIIRVTPAELESMAKNYATESGNVEHQIGQLDTYIDQLKAMWEGESSRAFEEQYLSLRPAFVDMQNLLQDIHDQLVSTAKALESADRDIANQIRG